MILCIAEKPSVAADIARILGARTKKDGYFEGSGYWVSWALGHLCSLKEPDDYSTEWKKWDIKKLPLLPEKYETKLINSSAARKQFKILKKLISGCDYVINCGDAGQEGELIQRWILNMASNKKKVKRLWISSLTDESIREGFSNLKPSENYDSLYYAAMCRACGDWLLGMNATRLYTLRYGQGGVLSVGRVQTPTLSMIVQRDDEIANFIPKNFFVIQTKYKGIIFELAEEKRQFSTIADAKNIVDEIKNHLISVKDISAKREKVAPKALYDLTSLQVDCDKLFGFSAGYTLKIAQTLYEKKLCTYPRTDSRCLTDDMFPKCKNILNSLKDEIPELNQIIDTQLIKRKKTFNNNKVSDHHAIIPTGLKPLNMGGDEHKVYSLISRRFASQFFSDAEYDKTEIMAMVGKYTFKATGRVLSVPGWKILFNSQLDSADEQTSVETVQTIPEITTGEKGVHYPEAVKKTTTPPKPFTEGTLLTAMETCGKRVENDELAEALKQNGIGRPSTRAAIIDTLIKRNYIRKVGKILSSTDAGKALLKVIDNDELCSPVLTGIWEKRLRDIEKGIYSPATFMTEIKKLVLDIITKAKQDNSGILIGTQNITGRRQSPRNTK